MEENLTQSTGKFAGKTVVIVGASSGIGRLAAISFARQGAHLGLIARSADGLASLADSLRKYGGKTFTIPLDVTDFGALQRAARDIAAEFGGIDIWINNAAVSIYAEALETSIDDARRVMDVNFFGQLHGVRAAMPHLEKSRGQIIATLSVDSEIGVPLHSAYVASKHALFGYYKVLHQELLHRRSKVKISTILPASIATPFFEHAKTQMGVRPKPMGPVYAPHHVVRTMLNVAESPRFSTVVGGAGRTMIHFHRRFPNAFYRLMSLVGYRQQRSNELKRDTDSNNLFAPAPGTSRVIGKDRPSPVANWMESGGRRMLLGAAVSAAAFLVLRNATAPQRPALRDRTASA